MIPLRGLLVPLLAGLVLIAIGYHARADDKPQLIAWSFGLMWLSMGSWQP